MTNLILPSILVATALLAGALAFMPIDEAQAVHTTVQGTQLNTVTAETNCSAGLLGDTLTATSDGAYLVHYIFTAITDAGTVTYSDGGGGAADIVLNTILDGTIAGTFAVNGGVTLTFTGDDNNTDGCITIIGLSTDAASIAIG